LNIRIFICSDDPLSCAGLVALLTDEEDFQVVGHSTRVMEALPHIREVSPDITIVSSLDADVAVHRELATVAKVVTFVSEPTVACSPGEVLALNARAVLAPGGTAGELMHAIRVVASGDTVLLPLAVRQHVESAVQKVAAARKGALASQLTSREADVLSLIAQGLSTADVARKLFVSTATVRSHVHHILQKLAVRSRTQAVAVAYEAGLFSLAMDGCDCGCGPRPSPPAPPAPEGKLLRDPADLPLDAARMPVTGARRPRVPVGIR
jgi:DNA-binding NarL/FixJ family response regulator